MARNRRSKIPTQSLPRIPWTGTKNRGPTKMTLDQDIIELLQAMYVQLSRIYDVLAVSTASEQIQELIAVHEQGGIVTPPPLLVDVDADPENI